MESTSDCVAEDQLYEVMFGVISKRKKCPAILSQLEEERIAQSIKRLDEAKVEFDDAAIKKDVNTTNTFIKKRLTEIPSVSLTEPAETRLIKSQRNMEKVKDFLDMRASR